MPEGIPNRLPALLRLAIQHCWTVTIRADLGRQAVHFDNLRDELVLVWEDGRLVVCTLLGRRRLDNRREPSKRMLLRDVPSILRGGT